MGRQTLNDLSGKFMIALAVIAFLTVLSGYFQAPRPDEGAAAHIFQITLALFVPAMVVFLATADAQQLHPLAISAVFLALAFGALYFLEHYFYVERYW